MSVITDLYQQLFGKDHIKDGNVIDFSEHGRTGGLSTGQGFKFVNQENSIDNNPLIADALNRIQGDYGDTVSVKNKSKILNKFGQASQIGTTFTTVMSFQGSETRLTYPSTNLIDTVASSAAGDTSKTYVVEGHSVDESGNLTFVSQDITTDATDGQTNGVPTTDSAVSMRLLAGDTQSEKCATSISQSDYWIINSVSIAISDASPTANFVTFRVVVRDVKNGGVFRPLGRDYVAYADTSQPGTKERVPYQIVPKNHDLEVLAKTDTGVVDVFAEVEGFLAN